MEKCIFPPCCTGWSSTLLLIWRHESVLSYCLGSRPWEVAVIEWEGFTVKNREHYDQSKVSVALFTSCHFGEGWPVMLGSKYWSSLLASELTTKTLGPKRCWTWPPSYETDHKWASIHFRESLPYQNLQSNIYACLTFMQSYSSISQLF